MKIKVEIEVDGVKYVSVETDDISAKCCEGCAFSGDGAKCPAIERKHINYIANCGIVFKKKENNDNP